MTSAIAIPIRFDSASYDVVVNVDGTDETLTLNVTSGRDYWMSGDGTADSSSGNGDLAALLHDLIESHSSTPSVDPIAVVREELIVQLRIVSDLPVQIKWSEAATTLDAEIFGWSNDEDSDEATSISSVSGAQGWWFPGAKFGPDSRDRITTLRGTDMAMDGTVYTSDFGNSAKRRDLTWELLDQSVILEEYSTGDTYSFEHAWRDSISKGRRFRVYETVDVDVSVASYSTYVKRDTNEPHLRNDQYPKRWDVELRMVASA